jgi:hypothetical protein
MTDKYLPNCSQIVLGICGNVHLGLGLNRPLFLSDFTQDSKCFDEVARNSEVSDFIKNLLAFMELL